MRMVAEIRVANDSRGSDRARSPVYSGAGLRGRAAVDAAPPGINRRTAEFEALRVDNAEL